VGDDHAFNLVSIFADTSCGRTMFTPCIFGRKSQPGIQDDNFIVVLENAGIFLPILQTAEGNNLMAGRIRCWSFVSLDCFLSLKI